MRIDQIFTYLPTSVYLDMWLFCSPCVAMCGACADLRSESCDKLENKNLFICMTATWQLYGGCMKAAWRPHNPHIRATYGPHVGSSIQVKLTPYSQQPHICLTSYLQRPHRTLIGPGKNMGISPATVRQPPHGGCICEVALMQLPNSMWLWGSQCVAFEGHAEDHR